MQLEKLSKSAEFHKSSTSGIRNVCKASKVITMMMMMMMMMLMTTMEITVMMMKAEIAVTKSYSVTFLN